MKKIIITGGAGFIGTNAAEYYLKRGDYVVIIDNLSRIGSNQNLKSLLSNYQNLEHNSVDISDNSRLLSIFKKHTDTDLILHLAAQTAVTTSVVSPRIDFESNAIGTFNVLEAYRLYCPNSTFIYSSTNKVYGNMENVPIEDDGKRYKYVSNHIGISEEQLLDFHSPYGCSKGVGDQYVNDYARIYGIRTLVFRQSCIYGPRQFGVEDQGWMAWFAIAALTDKEITIYGDGKQIRDVLFIDDLIQLYDLAYNCTDRNILRIFNIGGGMRNTLSLNEYLDILTNKFGLEFDVGYDSWRPGDQKVYISDISRAKTVLGWEPKTSIYGGIQKMIQWISSNLDMIKSLYHE